MPTDAPPPTRTKLKPWLEFGPLGVFLLVNAKWGLLPATAVLVPLSLLALVLLWKLEGHVPKLTLIGTVALLVFGGLSLALHDEELVKLKLTAIYGLLGLVLAIGLARGKAPIRAVLGANLAMTHAGWRLLTARTMVFCFVLALLNEVLRRVLSSDQWVTFKVFGVTGLTFVFLLAQAPLISRHATDEDSKPAA
jgi:intracellular septation protein